MNQSANVKKGNYISIQIKLLFVFSITFTIIFGAIYYWFYQYSTNAAMDRISEDLMNTLHGAVNGVNGDEFIAFVNTYGYESLSSLPYKERKSGTALPLEDEFYVQHQEWLNTIHQIEPKASPYTYVGGFEKIEKEGELRDEILWVGDYLRISDPENATLLFESYATVNMSTGLHEEYQVPYLYEDKWGGWMTAYAPIKNSAGIPVGGLGVDFRADEVFKIQRQIRSSIIVSFIISYILLLTVLFLINRYFTKPIVNLTKAAEKVGEGNYEQDFSSLKKQKLQDEIDTLADVFTIMVNKIYNREQNLRKQVEQLKIEINEVKRSKQVSEIVDTDFFRELQEKANIIRKRRQDASKKKK